jgi:hypothetical protein
LTPIGSNRKTRSPWTGARNPLEDVELLVVGSRHEVGKAVGEAIKLHLDFCHFFRDDAALLNHVRLLFHQGKKQLVVERDYSVVSFCHISF